ncbi:hypothetical protein [Alicyclobacillus ferrooxydans]|uniref:Uncharacterized protein n=1 Tax=Alicyclobacillus ferrooxydans TaxID=471514 RepID=A0A0P9GS12_9BACL|nr:hypothetical protein [Alicyclobacillus ferrooxydans]KPV43834.1 hypothetical protein AN477_10705 [Alicyclobacillus ferrooxydans]
MMKTNSKSKALLSTKKRPARLRAAIYLGKYTKTFLESAAKSPVLSYWLIQDAHVHWVMTGHAEVPLDFSLRLIDWRFGFTIAA